MERLRICYVGRVQGVGFRARVLDIAGSFPVVGQVRNMADGSVEVVAEGESSQLVAFSQAISSSLGRNIVDQHQYWSQCGVPSFEHFAIAASELK